MAKKTSSKRLHSVPDWVYYLAALSFIVFGGQVLNIVVFGVTGVLYFWPDLALTVVSGFLLAYCVIRLITNRGALKITNSATFTEVYYTPAMYVLVGLVCIVATGSLAGPIANLLRSARGLSPVTLDDWDLLGVTYFSIFLFLANVVYVIIALIIRAKRPAAGRRLFNIGLLAIVASCVIIAVMHINLAVGASPDSRPRF